MSENNLRPLDIAREALRRLAVERVPPTPDNYRAFYHDINGTQAEDDFPERALKLIAAALPRATPTRLRLANQFEHAIALRQWASVKHAIVALSESKNADTLPWGHLIRDLLTQLERPLKGVTTAQKRKSLEHALGAPGVDDDNWLHGQLELVTEVFTRPLDIRMLDEVERRLRDVIEKQGHLKRQLTDARARLRDMLVGFIDRLVPDEDSYCAIDRADKAMYAAKRAGKNRAFLAA